MAQVKEFINNICLAHVIGYLCKNLSYYSPKIIFLPFRKDFFLYSASTFLIIISFNFMFFYYFFQNSLTLIKISCVNSKSH